MDRKLFRSEILFNIVLALLQGSYEAHEPLEELKKCTQIPDENRTAFGEGVDAFSRGEVRKVEIFLTTRVRVFYH